VPLSQLQPGDLVFYGVAGPNSHHVGLYVGNDMMIHAPHLGASVRYDNIYSEGSDLLPYGGRP
jgi:cell wall-associated NlpC family hydrolase